jgi:hypothetical protein
LPTTTSTDKHWAVRSANDFLDLLKGKQNWACSTFSQISLERFVFLPSVVFFLHPALPTWRLLLGPAQTLMFREFGALPSVARRRHGVVGLEAESLAVSARREAVRGGKVPFERPELLAADQTDEVIRGE